MKIYVNLAQAVIMFVTATVLIATVAVVIPIIEQLDVGMLVYLCMLFGVSALVMFIFGFYMLQWVIMDESGITAKNSFGTIRHADWKDVTEIKGVWISYSFLSQGKKFLIFVDGMGSRGLPPTIYNRKDKYIRVAESDKCLEYLSKFHPEIKITEQTGFC